MSNMVSNPGQNGQQVPSGGLFAPPPFPRQKAPRRNDIVSRRNRWPSRLWRFLRTWVPWAALIGLLIWMWLDPVVLNIVITVVGTILQYAMILAFGILQFVAIFWFMSRSKTVIVLPEDPKVTTFDDYWGQPTLLRLVKQWISLLSDRDKFVEMGGNYINGILLYGPPGTGKTMLAKAMAGEAGIPFMSVEGSGFRGMFWGVDVLKMVAFCGKAKKLAREYGACIAYIDEIDAVGMSRGGVMGGGQGGMMGMGMGGMMGGGSGSLTRLLYEMDGIDEKTRTEKLRNRIMALLGKKAPARNWHVLYMGSTNRPEVLDPALLRPGRFDQKIEVGTPDKSGRRDVIKGYLRKVRYDTTVDVEAIVEDTPHATPAQIAGAITKDAVRIALFNGRAAISQRDIDQALQEQAMGIEHPIEEWDQEQKLQVAYHEAGHAVMQHYLLPEQRIVRVTIVRRGGALGYVMHVDRVEVYGAPLRRFAASIMISMAGHVATKLHMGEYWTGASSDFSQIRQAIWALYTFGYFGPPVRGLENSQTGGLPSSADPLIERFWKTLEDQTEQVLVKHASEVEAIAQALMQTGDLSHDEVMMLLGDNGYKPNAPSLRSQRALTGARLPRPLPAPLAAATPKRGDTAPNPAVKRDAVQASGGGSEDLMAPLSEAPALTVEHTQPNPPVRMEKDDPAQRSHDKPQSVSVSRSVKADKKSD
jgi:cell division protease FtsH